MREVWELHGGEVLTGNGLWVASQGRFGHVSVLPIESSGLDVDAGCHPAAFDGGGTCPVIVGATPGAVWTVTDVDPETLQMGPWMLRRFDTESGEMTLALDATNLITPDSVRLYADGVS